MMSIKKNQHAVKPFDFYILMPEKICLIHCSEQRLIPVLFKLCTPYKLVAVNAVEICREYHDVFVPDLK